MMLVHDKPTKMSLGAEVIYPIRKISLQFNDHTKHLFPSFFHFHIHHNFSKHLPQLFIHGLQSQFPSKITS